MKAISDQRLGEYFKTAFEILKDNNYECRSSKLIDEMAKRLNLSEYEKERTKIGQEERWVTHFRFNSIGLVKGGYIKKQKRVWYLTDLGKRLLPLTSLEIVKSNHDAYMKWYESRDLEKESAYPELPIAPDEKLVNMEIKPEQLSFTKLIQGVEDQSIQIPPFQRSFVWSSKEIVDLLNSIYYGYPIGSFIFWKTYKQLPYARKIGELSLQPIQHSGEINYVLDGQQRITSLFAAIKGALIEDDRIYFYFDLTISKFDYERNDPEKSKNSNEINKTRIPLENLFVKPPEYHKYVGQFPEEYQTKLHELFDRFHSYSFSIIYVQAEKEHENDDIKQIVRIFTKINETGRKLTVVAKMVARCWGENFDLRGKLDETYDALDDTQDIREETVLQIASVLLNDKRCKTRIILNETNIDELEEQWDSIIESLHLALDFLQSKLGIYNLKYLPFDSLLVPLSYFYYLNHNPSNMHIDQLKLWFWKACLSNRYGSSTEQKIEDDCYLFDKLLEDEKVDFQYDIAWDSMRIRLIELNYNLRNALCKTVLTLYSYQKPKNIKDNGNINLKDSFSILNKANLHHFFPRHYLDRTEDPNKELKDSIVNIAFCPFLVNTEASDSPPSDYLSQFKSLNPDLDSTLKSHLISDMKTFGLIDNNFKQFLDKRAEQIENMFRILVGLKSKTEQQFENEPDTPLNRFEVQIRNLIDDNLKKVYGDDYWRKAMLPELIESVNKKLKDHIKIHPTDKIEDLDSITLLSYLDIMDYQKIIESNWSIFEKIFGSKFELQKHLHSLKYYRNPIKHIRELNKVDQKSGEAAILWFEEIFHN